MAPNLTIATLEWYWHKNQTNKLIISNDLVGAEGFRPLGLHCCALAKNLEP